MYISFLNCTKEFYVEYNSVLGKKQRMEIGW